MRFEETFVQVYCPVLLWSFSFEAEKSLSWKVLPLNYYVSTFVTILENVDLFTNQ